MFTNNLTQKLFSFYVFLDYRREKINYCHCLLFESGALLHHYDELLCSPIRLQLRRYEPPFGIPPTAPTFSIMTLTSSARVSAQVVHSDAHEHHVIIASLRSLGSPSPVLRTHSAFAFMVDICTLSLHPRCASGAANTSFSSGQAVLLETYITPSLR